MSAAESFQPTLDFLLQHEKLQSISGFASINYRLSPYPKHPINPSSPNDVGRSAQHPDHTSDVLAALKHLQQGYGFGERYLLVGHSAGATLAFQVAMGDWESDSQIDKPIGILGVGGVYDLGAIVEDHKDIPVYEEIVNNAFGSKRSNWTAASPVSGKYNSTWTNGRLTVLAHSTDDELVDEHQHKLMGEALRRAHTTVGHGRQRRDLALAVQGKHDEFWKNGHAAAEIIITAIEELMQQD